MNSSISSLPGENNSPEKPKIIEVLELRLSHTGNVKAFCRVRIGALVLSGFKVVQQPGQRAWVSIPQLRDDKGHYYPMLQVLSPALKEQITEAVLTAWQISVAMWLGVRHG